MNSKRLISCIVCITLGILLTVLGALNVVDSYWGGMGSALIVVGALRLIQLIRYKTSETYRKTVDVETNDERNKYLAMKAWSWSGYLFVIAAAVASIGLKIAGQDTLSMFAGGSVCLVIVLYWLSWFVLRRKY